MTSFLKSLDYVHDICLPSHQVIDLGRMVLNLKKEVYAVGLRINTSKIKILNMSGNRILPTCVNERIVENVKQFFHLFGPNSIPVLSPKFGNAIMSVPVPSWDWSVPIFFLFTSVQAHGRFVERSDVTVDRSQIEKGGQLHCNRTHYRSMVDLWIFLELCGEVKSKSAGSNRDRWHVGVEGSFLVEYK